MKKLIFLLVFVFAFISCSSNDETISDEYVFVEEYSTTITVGGVIGISERTFEIGEVYQGVSLDENYVTIRIAEHSDLNDDCPNSWCYQELLDVPSEFLELVE